MRRVIMSVLPTMAFLSLLWAARPASAADCGGLTGLAVSSTTITSAAMVAAGGGFPEYCNVNGHVYTEIVFALRLPTQWNGKFYFAGLGGLDGARLGCILLECEMRPRGVVVAEITLQATTEVFLVQDDHVIE